MRRALWFSAFLVCCLLIAAGAPRAQLAQTGAGIGTPAAPAFQGMADIVASPFACWSLRACSSAKRGTAAVNVCNPSDVTCADLSTDATTGNLVITTIGGSSCSSVVCTIKIWYDQSGSNGCSGSNCNITQSTIANRPQLIVSCLNGHPCAQFTATSSQKLAATNAIIGYSQPNTISAVVERTGNLSANAPWYDSATTGNQVGFLNSANTIYYYFGGAPEPTATAADNAFHAIQSIISSSIGSAYIDGTSTSPMNVGTNGISGTVIFGNDSGSNYLTGNIAEIAAWNSAFSGAQQSSMNSNQHSYWGF